MKKRSFFERISGAVPLGDEYDSFDDDQQHQQQAPVPLRMGSKKAQPVAQAPAAQPATVEDDHFEGQLPVDVYQTPNEIVIRAFIAGVRADEVNVSISRDMVVLEGTREERDQVQGSDYFTRELFWGSFSRTILLPQEVDVDNASANAKDGLLTLILPKLDRTRQTKLRVKVG